MKSRHLAGLVLTFLLTTSCVGLQPSEVLLPRTDISLTVKGDVQITYDHKLCQIGYNELNHEFRLINDKLTDWMIFRSDATPAEVGQKVNAYLEYTVADDTRKMSDVTFTVEKTDSEGLVWMWNHEKSIGLIIKIL